MTVIRAFLLLVLVALPAHAADVVYPTGSRIGLAPPTGLSPSRSFSGFEDVNRRVALVLTILPPDAFAAIEKSAAPEPLRRQGVELESREDIAHPLGKAVLMIGRQEFEGVKLRKWILAVAASDLTALVTVQVPDAARETYPDTAIHAALQSLTVRASVPAEEQLSLLPFRVSELAGFNVGGVVAGRAVMLTDGAADAPAPGAETHIVVAVAPGGPSQASERGRFANDVFASIPNLKDVRITSSEPLRISGAQGHQIMASGHDGTSGQEITIVQWLRFGGGGYLHLIGVARKDAWAEAYPRFRQVRDGIELR